MKNKKVFQPCLERFLFKNEEEKVLKRLYNLGYPTALQLWIEVTLFASGIF